jgi:hypothetical protein
MAMMMMMRSSSSRRRRRRRKKRRVCGSGNISRIRSTHGPT